MGRAGVEPATHGFSEFVSKDIIAASKRTYGNPRCQPDNQPDNLPSELVLLIKKWDALPTNIKDAIRALIKNP